MLIKFGPRWLRAKEDDGAGGSAAGSGDKGKQAADNDNGGDLAAENKKLKADLAALGPRLTKFEEAEAKREAAAKKAEDDRKKKELGVEKVLEEKDGELKTTKEKLDAYEKREAARVDAIYATLPEAAQQALEPLKAKLDLVDWAELVEKQATLLTTTEQKDVEPGMSTFIKPGTNASRGAHEPSPKTKEILEAIGKGDTMTGKLQVNRVVDPENGTRTTRFTRQVRTFFKDMNLARSFRLGVKQ
jgi:hypothetical protein